MASQDWLEKERETAYITLLPSVSDEALRTAQLRSRRIFDVIYVVKCLVLSGFLRDTHDCREAVRHAIGVVTHEAGPTLRRFVEEIMNDVRIPSATTLYRHRLSFQAGACGKPICMSRC